ncbi:MAG TPA: TetR/AcrR family transcriptional regulator [Solirubrobacteraceae bacterium]
MSSSSSSKRQYRMSARAETTAATGERLLTAAWRHFASRPYEDVRLQEIAAEAGVSAQTLHSRFGSKDRLLMTAFWWWGQREIALRDAAPVGQVGQAIRLLYEHYEAHGTAVLRMLSQEERNPAVRGLTDAGRAYHRAWAQRTFAPLLKGQRGGARERHLAAIVVATDLLVWKLLRRDMGLDRAHAEQVVAEMVQGKPPPQPVRKLRN